MKTPVVLITGPLTGIGRATARAFATEGARVVVSGRRDDEGERVVAELRELGAEVDFLRADVRREDDVRGLVDKAVALRHVGCGRQQCRHRGKPGPVIGRFGWPVDIVPAVVCLASEDSGWLTGERITGVRRIALRMEVETMAKQMTLPGTEPGWPLAWFRTD